MNKKLLIVTIVVVTGAILYGFYEAYLGKGDKDTAQSGILPSVTRAPTPTSSLSYFTEKDVPQGEYIELNGVKFKNFYKEIPDYGLLGDVKILHTRDYMVFYFPLDKAFQIIIYSSPFENYRITAELDLIRKLNISRDDACKIKVVITTPFKVNPEESGKEHPISWCK